MSEHRAGETTRVLLRSFGVMVTTYEERMAQLLAEAARDDLTAEEALRLAASALALSARLTHRLQEVTAHVLETERQALAALQEKLAARFPSAAAGEPAE
jgi:Lon protease-like protein